MILICLGALFIFYLFEVTLEYVEKKYGYWASFLYLLLFITVITIIFI